jgi:hypothetical protein
MVKVASEIAPVVVATGWPQTLGTTSRTAEHKTRQRISLECIEIPPQGRSVGIGFSKPLSTYGEYDPAAKNCQMKKS